MNFLISLLLIPGISWAVKYGEGRLDSAKANLEDLIKNSDAFLGKKIVVEGKVREVCQRAGCWLIVESGKAKIRIVTKDKAFFVPKTLTGKVVAAEGVLNRKDGKLEFIADAISADQ